MWTIDEAPDQSSRTAVVTGANVGLGRETARAEEGYEPGHAYDRSKLANLLWPSGALSASPPGSTV